MSDVKSVHEAVKLLDGHPNYTDLKRRIEELSKHEHEGFIEDLSTLNALVDLGRRDPRALGNVWDLLERPYRSSKADYQRSYMAAMRARLKKAVALEEGLRGERMDPDERDTFRKTQKAMWMTQRDEFVAEHAPGATRNSQEWRDAVREFWAIVDRRLDEDLAEARGPDG